MIYRNLKKILKHLFKNKLNNFLAKKNMIVIFRNGSAIGDHVYMSSILKKIANRGIKIILFSNYYELFLNNNRVYRLYQINSRNIIWFFLNIFKGKNILEFRSDKDQNNEKHFLFFHQDKKVHIAEASSQHFNLDLDTNPLKNEFFFDEEELENYSKTIKLPNKFALIQSTSKKTFTSNKEWDFNGMQAIVNHFTNINWIQVGRSDEPILQNCSQLFDLNLRKLAYIISKSQFLVTYEGLFNHFASCFDKKIFVIHTGFLPVESFKYVNSIIIENNKNYPCFPCYDLNCKKHQDLTKKNIKVEDVLHKIEKNIL
tara:strand:+ start:3456 stop:4397 length:942 start_codon:yes stop_codon:yes gene_type:complete